MNRFTNTVIALFCILIIALPVLGWFIFYNSAEFDDACMKANGIPIHDVQENFCISVDAIIKIPQSGN